MHALIIVSHPNPQSLTHAIARGFAEGIGQCSRHTTEFADLAAEGFQAAYKLADRAAHQLEAALPMEVRIEQERVDRADALALIYPIYWWSFPGLLKGWIDRVFTNGWAYSEGADGRVEKRLSRLNVHLIGVGGAGSGTYARHGYDQAMRTQIDHGIFDYCGAKVVTSELLLDTNGQAAAGHVPAARTLGTQVFLATSMGKSGQVRPASATRGFA